MDALHTLLARQLRRFGLDPGKLDGPTREFVEAIDRAYRGFDDDRRRLERSLELSSAELIQANGEMRSILEAFPDLHLRLGPDGTIVSTQDAGGARADAYRAALAGPRFQDATDEETRRLLVEAVASAPSSVDYTLPVEGRKRHYEARLRRLPGGGLFAVVRDISERKHLEARVAQSEKLSAIGQLAAGVAHEINNPLGVILGFAQTLVRRLGADPALAFPLRSIERETLRCKDLVQNLLTFSRQDRPCQEERLDLSYAVDKALTLIETQARVRGVELRRELACGLLPILGSPNKIQQVVINLCSNAIDATPSGGAVTVTCRARDADGREWARLEVADTGTGIPAAIRKKIFDPFFTTKEPGKGTGLGLALVHELVAHHHGRIDFASEVGRGTTFFVDFPLAADAAPSSAPAQSPAAAGAP